MASTGRTSFGDADGGAAGTYLGSGILAAALAVGSTVLLMHYLRCLHPPGAATAFFFVTGLEHIPLQETCLAFLLNISVIVVLALLLNNAFHWRRYPLFWFTQQQAKPSKTDSVELEDLHRVLQQHNVFIDISLEELKSLYVEAQQSKHTNKL